MSTILLFFAQIKDLVENFITFITPLTTHFLFFEIRQYIFERQSSDDQKASSSLKVLILNLQHEDYLLSNVSTLVDFPFQSFFQISI